MGRLPFHSRLFRQSKFSLKEPAMLVLSRHRDESIMIGDNVMITIVDIRGDKVRLGIDAPQEIPVHRQEVYDAIKRENEKARRLGPSETRDIGK
jgi:carbon storage regulator